MHNLDYVKFVYREEVSQLNTLRSGLLCVIIYAIITTLTMPTTMAVTEQSEPNIYDERRALFDAMSQLTNIPWYYLAGIDQYERSLNTAHKNDRPQRDGLIAIYIPSEQWAGPTNPDLNDDHPATIQLNRLAGDRKSTR